MEGNYRNELVCPKCGKRKIYVGEDADGYYYYCTVCDYNRRV